MKQIGLLVVVGVLAVWTTFAGGGQEDRSQPVTLTIAGRDGPYGEAMELGIELYRRENPGVEFELLQLSGTALFEQTVVDLRSGADSYDIVLIDDPNAPQYMEAGWLADLDALFAARGAQLDGDFIASAVGVGRFPAGEGTLYALPIVGNVALFAYRTDLFARYNLSPPDRWVDVLAATQTLRAAEPEVAPVIFRGSKGNPIVTGFLPILWAFGGDVLDANGGVVFESPETLSALEFFLELSTYAPAGVANYQSAQVRDALYNGSGAIAIEVWPGWITELNDPEQSAVVDMMEVRAHPGQVRGSSPMIGIWLAGIASTSRHQEEAFDFLTFLTSAETQTAIAMETGVPPTRVSVHQDPLLRERYFWYPAQLEGLQNGVARPRTNRWSEIETNLGEYLQLMVIGEISPQEAMSDAAERIERIVR